MAITHTHTPSTNSATPTVKSLCQGSQGSGLGVLVPSCPEGIYGWVSRSQDHPLVSHSIFILAILPTPSIHTIFTNHSVLLHNSRVA